MTVLIEKKIADAIEVLRGQGYSNQQIITEGMNVNNVFRKEKELVYSMDFDTMVKALYEGYDIVFETKPEEVILEMYNENKKIYEYDRMQAIEATLNILGVKIKGVNE